MGIGASPIREALSLLTSDHLVVRQDQRGFKAAETSRENFQEILELRCDLEAMALRRSIQNATEAWAETVVVAHHRMTRAQVDVSKDFEKLHKEFHLSLISNCNAPLLLGFCSQLYDLNIRYRYIAARASGYEGRKIGDEHRLILDTVLAHDFDATSALLAKHYKTTGAFVATYIS